jgi:general secretion pathway protein L
MSEYLVIRLGEKPDQLVQWIAVDSSGARHSAPAEGLLGDAVVDIGNREVIVLVPSAEVLSTTVDIPLKGTKLIAALPFALEEYLADDIDQLHFAAGTRRANGKVPVSVVSRQNMDDWLDILADAGIKPASVMADSYGLARIPGTISMLLAEGQVFINDGANIELAMQGVSPGDALAAIGALDESEGGADDGDEQEVAQLPRHVLVYCEAADEERYQHDWIAMRQELDSVDVKLLSDGIIPRLAATVATGAGINMLQGQYGKKKEYSGFFKPWKYAAMLLVGFVIVGMAAKATDYYLLTKQEAELRQLFNTEYQQTLPGAPETDDPIRVIESLQQRLGNAKSPPIFLQTMEQLSQAIQQNSEANVQAISFRAGVVDIRITAPNVATLDGIQRAITASGQFRAAIQSTDQDGEKVSSRMQIQEVGR